MRRLLEQPTIHALNDTEKSNQWKNRSVVHLVPGLSVPEAKRVVKQLGDVSFDPERAQLVRLPSKGMIERYRVEKGKATQVDRPRRAEPATGPPRSVRPQPAKATFERALLLCFLLAMLGLQVFNLIRP